MFTGIITDIGTIARIEDRDALRRIEIRSSYPAADIAIGASIACSGPCLTVVETADDGAGSTFLVELSQETLDKTTAGDWVVGTTLNLERALALGAELGGHLVTGHIDGVAQITARDDTNDTSRFILSVPPNLAGFIAPKGSVALDGTSLTVNNVDGARFDIMLIPHTLAVTTWGDRRAGDWLNLEIDLLARYVARLTDWRATSEGQSP